MQGDNKLCFELQRKVEAHSDLSSIYSGEAMSDVMWFSLSQRAKSYGVTTQLKPLQRYFYTVCTL